MGNTIQRKGTLIDWRMFLDLEQDLLELSRYVEFSEDNFEVYSPRLASLLLTVCSEVDVVAKLLCQKLSPRRKRGGIGDYSNIIGPILQPLVEFRVYIPRYGLALWPWENWARSHRKAPAWWRSYNNVKHERNKHYNQATLGNLLNAAGGLYVLLLYLNKQAAESGELSPNPILFRPAESCMSGVVFDDIGFVIEYSLGG